MVNVSLAGGSTESLSHAARTAQLAALSRTFSEAVPDLARLLQLIAGCVAELTGDACTVRRLSEDGKRLEPVAARHQDPAIAGGLDALMQQTVDTRRAGVWSPVLEEHRTVRVAMEPGGVAPDSSSEQAAFQRSHPMRSFMLAPLVARGRLVGGISLSRYGHNTEPHSEADETFLQDVAERAALAIDNAQLFEAERHTRAAAEQSAAMVQSLNEQLERRVEERTAELQRLVTTLEQEIAERRRVERSGQISEARWRALFEHSLDAVLLTAPDGRILTANPAARQLFGMTEAEITAAGRSSIIDLTDTRLHSILEERARRGFVRGELRHRRKDGTTFPAEVTSAVFRDATGTEYTSLIIRDVSQIMALVKRLEQQNVALQEASRHKSEFLANMSHELRTPLNAINGFSRLLLAAGDAEYDPDTRRTYLQTILDSGQHLLELINDILDLSKVEAGRMELRLSTVDVDDLVRRVLATVQPLADRKHLLLSAEPSPSFGAAGAAGAAAAAGGGGSIEADEGKLKQILYNLVSNAIKFTPDRGAVVVSTQRQADGVTIAVADTGIGIAPADQARVFEEFQQIDSGANRNYQGTGLGLALTRRFVELHGGRIWLESAPGAGSQFYVFLPFHRGSEAMPGVAVEPGDQALAGPAEPPASTLVPADAHPALPGSSPLVLVVDDDPRSVHLLTTYLHGGGYRTATATDGAQVLTQARALRPAAITLDILLPRLDGWEVLRELKSDPEARDIPVVIVSIVDDDRLGYALGAADYLVKPVDDSTLLACLDRHVPITERSMREVRVLAIDDDLAALELIARYLQPTGVTVLRAGGGAEGILEAQRHHPDLILLDLMMPEVSGFDVIDTLKGDPATRAIPIVVVTAKNLMPEDRAQLAGQVATVLAKGKFGHVDLLTCLRALTGVAVRGRTN